MWLFLLIIAATIIAILVLLIFYVGPSMSQSRRHGHHSHTGLTGCTGTWTPELSFGDVVTGITYSTQLGQYTRHGNVVNYSFRLALTSKGTHTGAAQVSGFPIAEASPLNGATVVAVVSNMTLDTGSSYVVALVNGSVASLYESSSVGAGQTTLTNTQFSNTTTLEASGFYFTN